MIRYLFQRLMWSLFVIVGIITLMFVISNVIPADPALLAAGPNASEDQVAQLRRELGLNQPVIWQYIQYIDRLGHGDLGRSARSKQPVLEEIALYFPATLELAFAAMTLYVFLGVPFGIAAATRAGSRADKGIQALSVFGLAIPSFWLALFMQLIFFYWLRWLPSVGRLDMGMVAPRTITGLLTVDSVLVGDWAALGSALRHLILPATTLALAGLANIVRLTRRSMMEILHEDYIKAARAKGLSERTVIFKHAFRNALIPVLTMIGLQAGYMLSGAVLVEVVFSWPGVGGYIVESISYLDFQPIMGATLLIALGFLAINFAVDVLYVAADPRIGWS